MNFLAHLHLSGNNDQLMIGNFMGDFVKGGNLTGTYAPAIVKGIGLHRAIDQFTDAHQIVKDSKNRLRPKYRHYSGVIVDMFYDHFLAKNWNRFHHETLNDYARGFYSLARQYEPVFPKKLQSLMPYMIAQNWLVNYAHTEGLQQALKGMSRRTSFDSKMDQAVVDLNTHYQAFENEFMEFFPSLRKFSADWVQLH